MIEFVELSQLHWTLYRASAAAVAATADLSECEFDFGDTLSAVAAVVVVVVE